MRRWGTGAVASWDKTDAYSKPYEKTSFSEPCHPPHKEIAYLAEPTTSGSMLLMHVPVYGPLRGEMIWQILE